MFQPLSPRQTVIDQLDAGDVLMVTRLDRLARSTHDPRSAICVGYAQTHDAQIKERREGERGLP